MQGTRLACLFSLGLAVLAGTCLSAGEADTKVDEKILQQAGLKTDGPALVEFFKQRTLNDTEMIQIEALIQQLGANSFAKRELASTKLVARGPVIVPILKKYYEDKDLEIAGRVKKCVEKIQEKDYPLEVLMAAARLTAARKTPGTADVLLQFLPFADNDTVAEEVRTALGALALRDGKAEPALVKGLTDKNAVIRSAAGEALALSQDMPHEKQVWKLLEDPETLVRYRVALGLTMAGQAKAVPILIGLVPDLDQSQAWQVEDLLYRLAAGNNPPQVSLAQTKESREKFSKAWAGWWEQHAGKVNLASLKAGPKLLGYTILILLEAGQIMELGHNNEVRWQVNNLNFPLDVQMLPNDHLLIAEYHAGKVTERDLKGEIKWQYPTFGPLVAQRLKNGNTFIVTDEELIEVDQNKNKKWSHFFPKGERIMKATKLDDGRVVALTNGVRVVVVDEKHNETKSFNIVMGKHLFGGRLYMTPTGRVLIPHNAENKVVEYDLDGTVVWEKKLDQPVAAVRLPNGNTLVTTMDMPGKAIEFDRNGHEVWSYATKSASKITRALRR